MNPNVTLSVEMAYNELRSRILCGLLTPGARLVTQQLALILDLSRTPITEALARLESDGLVARMGSWGYSVREITLKDAEEIFEARMVIEVACAQFSARHANIADINVMERVLEKTRNVLSKGKQDKFLIQSRLLHRQIAESSRNSILLKMFDQVNSLVLLYASSIVHADPGRMQEIVAENEVLVMAIKDHDEDLAGRLIRSQVLKARDRYRGLISGGRLNAAIKLNELEAG